ncbi:hypothetical protein TNCV_2333101 [Trichonephila clavipes]|nr:hypothetical protein TNCV_2333101 [Trichonephila clavipes]
MTLDTLKLRYPSSEWLRVYNDGSCSTDSSNVGALVFCELFPFYIPFGRSRTTFDVAQQLKDARAYCVHPTIRDHWALRFMSVYLSSGQSEVRSSEFKSPSKLSAHLSTHCSRDVRLSRSCPAPTLWKHDTLPLHHWAS